MRPFKSGQWLESFRLNGLDSFDAWWNLDIGWFEEPNQRRGGWSGVSRTTLTTDGGTAGIFVKRQENHVFRSLLHPWRGQLTFVREYRNIRRYEKAGVPTLDVIYFATDQLAGNRRAVLVTRELEGFLPLDEYVAQNQPDRHVRGALATATGGVVRRLHDNHLQHNCLYPKHIFVRRRDDGFDVRLIDLEKTKWRLWRAQAVYRDLDSLSRHAYGWSRTDKLRFLLAYTKQLKLDKRGRALWKHLAQKARRKKKK